MISLPQLRTFVLFSAGLAFAAVASAQTPVPAAGKGPDKEVAERIATLKEVVADKKFAREGEGGEAIDKLVQKREGLDAKDTTAIVKALEGVFTGGKQRPADKSELYRAAAMGLAYFGVDGAKVLKEAYVSKRFPDKTEWVPFREHVLKCLGRTKDESMIKFLVNEAVRSPQPALAAAAGEALGNFDEAKEPVRKEIVSDLLKNYGELAEKASQLGTNVEAQNAQDRLAALQDKWNSTLGKLTRQNFTSFREWQAWHNKNKNQPW
jgi:hypothetical protein